jgi:hypothetical protein
MVTRLTIVAGGRNAAERGQDSTDLVEPMVRVISSSKHNRPKTISDSRSEWMRPDK